MTISRENRKTARELSKGYPRTGLEATSAFLQAERDVLVGILETLSRSRHMNEYLEQLVEHIRNYSGCRCVGIRLLDDEGNIPYVSYTGFSREFYESESFLSIKWNKCFCINVIKGNTDPRIPFYTVGMVSHELRSPLTVIMGAVHTALTEEERLSPEERRQLLQDAASEAESLSHLLGNLLELSRVQANRLFLFVEPTNVENVAQNAVEKISPQSSVHRFVIDFSKELPLVHADQLRLERILYNLLENAVKYSPQGGEIRVFATPEKERLVIGVSDQGIGMSPHDQAKIFGPFQRIEDSRLDGVKGAGLGLLVCRRLVEAHGGRIWVESEPSRGSTFFFALPLISLPEV